MSRRCGSKHRPTAVRAGKFVMGWLFLLIFAVAPSVWAEDQSASSIGREVKDIFDRCKKAVVKIHGDDEHCELSGTGFFIDPTGTIYTAYSVGGEGNIFGVEFVGRNFPRQRPVTVVRTGFAILKVVDASPALPIAKS